VRERERDAKGNNIHISNGSVSLNDADTVMSIAYDLSLLVKAQIVSLMTWVLMVVLF
jgi:hypothetical protein